MSEEKNPAITVKNLSITRGTKELYRDFSVSFERGTVTAILGASGSGKTTLLDCMAGLLIPPNGSFSGGLGMRRAVSYLFQEPRLLPWCTLLQNVQLPLENVLNQAESENLAGKFLEKTGLYARKNDYPAQLSGGERQRTALARAFAFPAPVLLMDEPFQSQDAELKNQLMRLFTSLLESEERTVIMVSHDIREALYLADRIMVIAGLPISVRTDEKKENTPNGLHRLEQTILHILGEKKC